MKKKTLHPSGFTSKWRAYSSTTTPPTEPGRYTMTVVVLGGNYLASQDQPVLPDHEVERLNGKIAGPVTRDQETFI